LRVSVDLAVAVTLERSLAAADLAGAGIEIVARLDALAVDVRPSGAVGGATALYLRQLSGGERRERGSPRNRVGPFSLPGRLVARLASLDGEAVPGLLEGDLELSIAWERAALLEARTVGEWASLKAVDVLTAQAARPSAAPQPTGA
jgi:hypothetical protein